MLNKEKIATIIKDFYEKGIPWLIERKLEIPIEIPIKRIISIIGPRRAGKTYSMFQLIKKLLEKYKISQILYLNFELTALKNLSSKDLDLITETYYEIYPENKSRKVWFFLDEIQNIEHWETWVRTLLEEDINVFISGSSSKLLSKEIATQLRGRSLTYTILPFSFMEFLRAKKIEIKKYLSSKERVRMMKELRNYLNFGGYPEVILYLKEREKIISEIVETTIYRDVIERYRIKNIKALRILITSLINSVTKNFSVHKFYNFLKSQGMKVSKTTLYEYLEALKDVFFIFTLHKFSFSLRKSEQTLPKVYLVDNGILYVNGIRDKGKLMENLILIELKRRGKNVYYWSNNYEVDFVIINGKKIEQLIQVCYDISDYETKEREVKGLIKAEESLKCKNLLCITWDYEGEEKIKGKKIKFVPLWKWLLSFSSASPSKFSRKGSDSFKF